MELFERGGRQQVSYIETAIAFPLTQIGDVILPFSHAQLYV
jgi:hypothetical protein